VAWQLHPTTEVVAGQPYTLWSLESFESASADLYGQLKGRGTPRLRDDLSPMFGVIWGAARVLAEWATVTELRGERVLELGCGLALPSLVAARRGAEVLATDQHPDTGELLARNAEANGVSVAYRTLDWREPVALGTFDRVWASDVLFSRELPELVASMFARFLAPGGVGWLADPGRAWLDEADTAARAHGLHTDLQVDRAPSGDEAFVLVLRRGP
jgi:predicted nicotinamide N-methyase